MNFWSQNSNESIDDCSKRLSDWYLPLWQILDSILFAFCEFKLWLEHISTLFGITWPGLFFCFVFSSKKGLKRPHLPYCKSQPESHLGVLSGPYRPAAFTSWISPSVVHPPLFVHTCRSRFYLGQFILSRLQGCNSQVAIKSCPYFWYEGKCFNTQNIFASQSWHWSSILSFWKHCCRGILLSSLTWLNLFRVTYNYVDLLAQDKKTTTSWEETANNLWPEAECIYQRLTEIGCRSFLMPDSCGL